MKYRDYKIVAASSSPNLVEIKFDGSGKVAECLVGLYTSKTDAMRQIDRYLNGALSTGKRNGKSTSESGV